jgi:hypothetical protein
MFHIQPKRNRRSRIPKPLLFLAGFILLALAAILLYQLPPIRQNLEWRISNLRSQIKYAISPPEEAVFTPNPTIVAIVQATMDAFTRTPQASPTTTFNPDTRTTPDFTTTPTPTITPIPDSILLNGIKHDYQYWNNCGPTNLAMALSYWGWQGTQADTAVFLKPNSRDKNVMPYEMADYIWEMTDLNVVVRLGGDIELIKHLIAGGFPVIIEKGFDSSKTGWIGHYQVLAGYDERVGIFNAYDSYEGDFSEGQTLLEPYEEIKSYWRHFNYLFIVIFPPEKQSEVFAILGPLQDETYSFEHAAQLASEEIYNLAGRDLFFAWYNRGTSLMRLKDYSSAAYAYDEAFNVYAGLDPAERPWRVFWYQTGPYFAYYYTGRYDDVINLSSQTIANTEEPALEESFYWRALSKEALGDQEGAIEDYLTSLKWHPGFTPSQTELDRLGVPY